MKDYTNYKCNDYLDDDFFVKAMLFPTEKTRLFWQEMIDRKRIDVDEFIAANMMLKAYENNRPEMSPEREEVLWESIDRDRKILQRKRRKILLYTFALAVACIAGLAVLLLPRQAKGRNGETDSAEYKIINRQQIPNDILIVTGSRQLKVASDNPEITYSRAGTFSINSQPQQLDDPADRHASPSALSRIEVPPGKRAQLKLSDGTMLWINTGTTVIYPRVFSGEKREIFVDGEIYADIKPDAGKPFVIKTDGLEIRVRGTELNVASRGTHEAKQVVLVSGSVEIKQNDNNLQMLPGQLFTATESGSSLKTVDPEVYTSWRDGICIFEDEEIEAILLKLAKHYNVTMLLPHHPSGIVCFGKLELKDDLPALLNALSQIASFNFAIKDHQYRIQFN
jgi:ferric-dicitrate binding protein FerR (iron transport regulator)